MVQMQPSHTKDGFSQSACVPLMVKATLNLS